jgi:pectate lyase/fibronectin type 3 domain-containing protein
MVLVFGLIATLFSNVFTYPIAKAAGPLPDGTLPAGWKAADVSASSQLGANSYDFNNGTFALSATGGKIQSTDDNVLYAYYHVGAGDFSITAKVTSTAIHTTNNRALLMIKKDPITDGAISYGYTLGYNSSANTLISYRRLSTVGSSSFTIPDPDTPVYMRLERSGSSFKTYYSKDGINFGNGTTSNPLKTDSDTAGVLSGEVYVGLAVAAASAQFTDVQIYQNGILYDSNAGVEAPAIPENLTAVSIDSVVTLQWTAVSGASSYNIYRSTTSGSGYSKIGTSTTTSFTDSNVVGSTQYFYSVSAQAGGMESGISAESSVTTPLSAPTGLFAVAGDGTIQLTWTAAKGSTSYNVKRGIDGLSLATIREGVSESSFTDDGVSNGTTYYYAVSAVNENGESANSNMVHASPISESNEPVEGAVYAASNGLDRNPGTIDSPTTFESALTKVAPGGTIYLRGGTYSYSTQITIERDNSGTPSAKKHIFAFGNERPVLDFSSQPYDASNVGNNARGLQINGSYWYVKGLEVKGSADNGIYIAGHYNRIENTETHHNGDTGLQIGRYASTAPPSEWPSYNEIVNGYSHNNFDRDNGEDADGFAAKLTVGPGNVFDGCIASYNVDDGWDLYTKTDTGPIGAVTIRSSIAYNNGQTSDGNTTTNSDGNGFKLGGEKIAVDHIVINSVAFNNKKHGFTFNSNPGSITMINNTSYNNGQSNFAFDLGTHQFTNNLSYKGSSSDKTSGTDIDSTNVWWKNNKSTSAKGLLASDADFVSLTPLVSRHSDGSPNMGNFLRLSETSDIKGAGTPSGTDIGALFGTSGTIPNPNPNPGPDPDPEPEPEPDPGTPPPSGSYGEYDLMGFAAGTTGGGVLPESDTRYIKVYNAEDLAEAINRKKGYKVIEIMNDLDLGWNELSAAAKTTAGNLIVSHNTPQTHPVLLQTGVSKIYLDTLKDVTIFSAGGAKIKHAGFVIKYSSNIIIRNLEFDELWEWDEASKGDYDKNDWDYITIEGASSKIWIDHCTFNKAYDGVLDVKKGSNGVTISWSMFKGDDGSANSWVSKQIHALEADKAKYAMYNYLRSLGLSVEDIIAVVSSQKKGHLVGSTEFASDNPNLEVTLHHNYYKNMQDRMPRLRGGNLHVFNIVMDSSDARAAGKRITPAMASSISSKGYKFGVTSNGAISTENGAVLVEKSQIIDILYPVRNNQADPNNQQYTGKIFAADTIYSLDGISFRGNSDTEGSPLSPIPAPVLPFSWNGFTALPYSYSADDPATLQSRLLAGNGAGAGMLIWAKENWLLTDVPDPIHTPAQVTGLTANLSTNQGGEVTLIWNIVEKAHTYKVYRSASQEGPFVLIADHLSANAHTDSGLTAGTTYFYAVTASNEAGEGAKSVAASVTIPLLNLAPTTVITSHSVGQLLNINEPKLTWTFTDSDYNDFQSAYQVQASSDDWITIAADSGEIADASSSYTMGVLPDGNWSLRVRTKDRYGAWSEWAFRSIVIDTVAPTAAIHYSAVHPTNQDVVVTLMPSEPVTVKNNDGLASYIVRQNGSFAFTFEDAAGNTGSAVAVVNNIDKTAPTIQIKLDKTTLWPANNKPIFITANVQSSDDHSGIESVVLTSITPSYDDGSGNMVKDAEYGTLDTTFTLLAKKAGDKTDLVYLVTYIATDRAGNTTEATAAVTVPHNQSGK